MKFDSPLHDAAGSPILPLLVKLLCCMMLREVKSRIFAGFFPLHHEPETESQLVKSSRCSLQGGDLLHAACCSGESDLTLQNAARSQILLLHHKQGVRSYRCKMQRGVIGKIPGTISPLHNAAVRFHLPLKDAVDSQIFLLHDAAGSQFGNGESSLNTLEDSLGSKRDNHVKNHI